MVSTYQNRHMMEFSVHSENRLHRQRYNDIKHELNIRNMQMPQVLQFISAYLNHSIAFCFIFGNLTFSFVLISVFIYIHGGLLVV